MSDDVKTEDWREAIQYAAIVYARHCAGCCAHIILDDCNIEQDHAEYCLHHARHVGHADCIALCEVLVRMSPTQRKKLYHCNEFRS
jgi:hypothetical protein